MLFCFSLSPSFNLTLEAVSICTDPSISSRVALAHATRVRTHSWPAHVRPQCIRVYDESGGVWYHWQGHGEVNVKNDVAWQVNINCYNLDTITLDKMFLNAILIVCLNIWINFSHHATILKGCLKSHSQSCSSWLKSIQIRNALK